MKLTEIIKDILKEKVPDTGHQGEEFQELPENIQFLYHSTDIEDALKIVKSGAIKTGDNIHQDSGEDPWWRDEEFSKPHYGEYVYAASQPETKMHYGSATPEITFVIDSYKLKVPKYLSNMEEGTVYIFGDVPLDNIVEVWVNKKHVQDIRNLEVFVKFLTKAFPQIGISSK